MSKMPPIDVTPEEWEIVRDILARQMPDREVWAFGSRVTGRARRYSDLDLAIVGDRPMGLGEYGALKEAFSDSDLPWKVDVMDWAAAEGAFREVAGLNKVVIQQEKMVARVRG